MAERDIAALETYPLVPRLLHDVHEVDTSARLLGEVRTTPIVPLVEGVTRGGLELAGLSLIEAGVLLSQTESFRYTEAVPLLKTEKMGALMPKVRDLAARGVPAVALDFSVLSDTPPYGNEDWRPKTREDLAELRAAAGCPVWLYGICSPSDAEVAVEAGLEALIVHAGAGFYLGGPATIEMFPDIFDTVAGMISIYAGGPVRTGIDVFRYLAVGAEAVIVDSDRSLANLRAELEYAMRLTGCATLADIGYEALFAPLFGEV